ncbi:serine/threonine-protein kinase HT1 isoform X1 [Prunus yedoensis var. nudiflora]|uniref:Serine/threonine-protein kinase HT1 isoform X1 n=1 Tax=Prunus yedoensis var. nudiflora TaxID=2094558 RepID=A0A314Y0V6_PRUYE|nr:serine/threonine-protein kinase HT1 isoform X1 [Prunus yedoensis var. nudiflora]
MNCSVNNGGRGEREHEQTVLRRSVEVEPILVPQQLTIDENLLVDPKLLFIGSKIGEGAHGKVYEGRYHDRIVAIKVLHRGSTSEERAALESRFAREVNMMSRVKHENLVKFIGACKDPLMVIVTELLPGMSLRKYLMSIRPNPLELHVAIKFALDIAHAMECLHANGIIHRDLKPVGACGGLYSTVTLRQGEKKHYNNKVDVYSFGIVLWELLTNRMPFEGMSNLQAAYAAAFKQERPRLPEDISPDLAFIIQSCWVEDPNLRPTFSQIIRMLNSFLFKLSPPSPPIPDTDTNEAAASNGTMSELSVRTRGKFAFLRQLFNAKRTKNSQ